jgi:hypothetical protein
MSELRPGCLCVRSSVDPGMWRGSEAARWGSLSASLHKRVARPVVLRHLLGAGPIGVYIMATATLPRHTNPYFRE